MESHQHLGGMSTAKALTVVTAADQCTRAALHFTKPSLDLNQQLFCAAV